MKQSWLSISVYLLPWWHKQDIIMKLMKILLIWDCELNLIMFIKIVDILKNFSQTGKKQ
jgi:hypothetical protein